MSEQKPVIFPTFVHFILLYLYVSLQLMCLRLSSFFIIKVSEQSFVLKYRADKVVVVSNEDKYDNHIT